jgi:pilus assembly protein CpaB
MRAKSMVLILIAGGCGLVASIGISQVMNRQQGGQAKLEMTPILVAAHDLDIGDKLDATSVRVEEWPKDRVPEGAIASIEKLKDIVPNTRMYEGEPILQRKLIDNLADSLPPIPEGYRVIPLKVNEAVAPALLLPGDRVDILGFFRKSGDIAETITRTVLTDVRVYAVNNQTERVTSEDGKQINAKTVSVLVKPTQVELLMLATEMGSIRLSLRGHNDTIEYEHPGTSVDELFGNAPERADEKRPPAQTAASDQPGLGSFKDWLDGKATADPQVGAARVADAGGNPYEMTIHTPDGVTMYTWRKPDQLPDIRILSAGGAPAPAPALPAPQEAAPQPEPVAPPAAGATPPGPNGPPATSPEDAAADDAESREDEPSRE